MGKKLSLLFYLLMLFLAGCVPLLNSFPEDVQHAFQSIKIETIPERNGQFLKNRLEKILTPEGNSPCRYRLRTQITKTEQLMGMGKDGTTRRVRTTVSVTYTLTLIATGDQVFSNTLQTHSSYNYLSEGYYANTVSEQASERSCLEVLANLMALDLGMFFSQGTKTNKTLGTS